MEEPKTLGRGWMSKQQRMQNKVIKGKPTRTKFDRPTVDRIWLTPPSPSLPASPTPSSPGNTKSSSSKNASISRSNSERTVCGSNSSTTSSSRSRGSIKGSNEPFEDFGTSNRIILWEPENDTKTNLAREKEKDEIEKRKESEKIKKNLFKKLFF